MTLLFKRANLLLMGLTVLLCSCNFNKVYINREEDRKEGQAFLDRFYDDIRTKNYARMDEIPTDSLKQLAGPNGISKLAKFINQKVGDYRGHSVDDAYIRRISGSRDETSYNFKLSVAYDRGTAQEIVGFKKENGSAIGLNSYRANSDLLMR